MRRTRVLKQRDDLRLRVGIVAGDEDHALPAGVVWIRAEHVGAERIGGFHDSRAGDKVGDEFTRRPPLEIVGNRVVRRVDDDLVAPIESSPWTASGTRSQGTAADTTPAIAFSLMRDESQMSWLTTCARKCSTPIPSPLTARTSRTRSSNTVNGPRQRLLPAHSPLT
jgi:hypothetical protein